MFSNSAGRLSEAESSGNLWSGFCRRVWRRCQPSLHLHGCQAKIPKIGSLVVPAEFGDVDGSGTGVESGCVVSHVKFVVAHVIAKHHGHRHHHHHHQYDHCDPSFYHRYHH